MATMITSECINCGACEPECPNTAIYQGGVSWEFNGVTGAALSQETFYIVPEKCTECVGFHNQEACAAVCPVDCCVPDPKIPETEEVLMARARQIHPTVDFPADFPSRFKVAGAAPAAAPAAAAPAASAPAAAAAPAPAAAPAAVGVRAEKAISAPKPPSAPKPMKMKDFPAELPSTFEDTLLSIQGPSQQTSLLWKTLALLTSPILGALPQAQKQTIEKAVGDVRVFSVAGSTGLNVIHNMILYPLLSAGAAVVLDGKALFSAQLKGSFVLGLTIALAETFVRVREGFRGTPLNEIPARAALYGYPLSMLTLPLLTVLRRNDPQVKNTVAVDGFHGGTFEEKTERERRYGEVYSVREEGAGYYIRFEFPRTVPKSAMKEQLQIDDFMPPYDYDLSLDGNSLVVKGSVRDGEVRRLAAVSPAFPPDFTTTIPLSAPVLGFKHRIEDRVLEVVLPKQ